MADALLVPTVHVALETAINLASAHVGPFPGIGNDFARLVSTLTMIQAFLRDAEEKQVAYLWAKLWLELLERVTFDAENLLDDFNYEMNRRRIEIQNQTKRKVCFFFFSLFNSIAFGRKMAKQIREINVNFERIHEDAMALGIVEQFHFERALSSPSGGRFIKNREIDPETIDTSFVGRDDDVSAILAQLTATDNNETISVLPIVGMGGIGKTALAQKVYNDPNIGRHFDLRMWVCVSEDFNADRLFRLMLESLLKEPMPEVESMDARVNRFKKLLDGKKYLLVLDDVWNKKSALWHDFLVCLKGITSQAMGSWILVTTRDRGVARIMGISSPLWSLKELSDHRCWLILKENAFGAGEVPNGLQHVGFKIAQRCLGLPLAASILGRMLRNKGIDEWQTLESGLQSLGGDENIGLVEILKLSFDRLPHASLKKCLAYCSIFPKGFQMERNQLIQLWAAEGFLHPRHDMYMEEVGNECFSILLDSNLFQDGEKDDYGNVLNCKMHDLV
ncbi:putative disease resistance protein RGA3 [Coffea arabica]|uniref:Disease resistance protein RGA3 n=1 Tax=Coffea arabica TaxID=13443 RepID=A0A6P6WVN8_COFAR|nr:putative disease resistance protein RGA3 [Coffea arabica]